MIWGVVISSALEWYWLLLLAAGFFVLDPVLAGMSAGVNEANQTIESLLLVVVTALLKLGSWAAEAGQWLFLWAAMFELVV